ncbi:MAG: acetyltransferase, N-acetylglutamate synthase [Belnapia sp.]|nr:acetyltransferase, N-acetylglutamate synthase [Belnapia sp.]
MELPPGLTCSIEDAPAEAEVEALSQQLEGFNERRWPGHQPWTPLALLIRRGATVVGGLTGESYAGWFFIRYFWLEEDIRRRGLGRQVIAAAEQRARERGCHGIYLDTFSFQAPDFYRKQGYVEFGRLPYPPQGERIWLRKSLLPGDPPNAAPSRAHPTGG